MITKAIVESIVDKYTIKVRIPRLDRTEYSSMRTPTEYLNEAIICTLGNYDPNIKVGDIVFVALDDQNEDEVIILGYLYREKRTEAYADVILGDLNIKNRATLPIETYIGNVKPIELSYIQGATGNLQSQITYLQDRVNKLMELTTSLVNEINNLKNPVREAN